ncbi:hypothetical protein, partial [Ilumatobacter sp.]|uniref:hypothetical protein n=1 Tax=Ilumatobacter sp. TaxID=1967498 RepID=UPI003C31EF7C
ALIQIPAGCPAPIPADLAFVGTVLAKDEFVEKGTVRYHIDQMRAGDAAPYAVDGVIDVRYGPDSLYVDVDAQYLVSAAVDPDIGALASKVSSDSPLFGGDAVVGLEDTEVVCPVVDDPIQTINVDGTPVDSSLLTPLFEDKRLLLSTLLVPAAIVGIVLVGLVLLRRGFDFGMQGIFALGRAAVMPTGDHRAARVRRHANATEAAALGLDVEDEPDQPTEPAPESTGDSATDTKLVDV